ncbi:MAG: hypothetical protein ACTSR2_00345 [Candidatus Hodarchaeales archaeon]
MAIPYWIGYDDSGSVIDKVWVYVDKFEAGSTKTFLITKKEGFSPDINNAAPSNFVDNFNRSDSSAVSNGWLESEGTYAYFYISGGALFLREDATSSVWVATMYRAIQSPSKIKNIKCRYYSPNQTYIMQNLIGFVAEDLSRVFALSFEINNKLALYDNGSAFAVSTLTWNKGSWNTFEMQIDHDTNNIRVYCNSNLYLDVTHEIDLSNARYFFVGRSGGYQQTGSGSGRAGTYRYDDVEYKSYDNYPSVTDTSYSNGLYRITLNNDTDTDFISTTVPIDASLLDIQNTDESLKIDVLKSDLSLAYWICKDECML